MKRFNYVKYQMRNSDYTYMLEAQDGGCAICGSKPEEGKRLDIDHDHQYDDDRDNPGIRGLLCGHCNRLLGFARDNPEVLEKAAEYLRNGGHSSRFYVEEGKLIPCEQNDW